MLEPRKMDEEWSKEHPLERNGIRNAPRTAGVYVILQVDEYPRYKFTTRIIEIGKSQQDLMQELENHLQRHTAANRIKRIKKESQVSYRCRSTASDEAPGTEKTLLNELEDRHWDIPVLNSTRGYSRNADSHYG